MPVLMTPDTRMTFLHAFTLPGLDEVLPPGDYDVLPDTGARFDPANPTVCSGRAQVRLHARQRQPCLARSLSVSLSALARAGLRDRERGRDRVDLFLDRMLADPMIWLVTAADRVTEGDVRTLYARLRRARQEAGRGMRPGARGMGRQTPAANDAGTAGLPVCEA